MKRILIVIVFACLGLTVLANLLAPSASTEALSAKTPTRTPTKTPTSSSTMYVNATSNVNVRSCASTSCAVVTTAAPGAAVRILDEEDDWYKVKVGTKTGYIAAFLLTKTKPSGSSTGSQSGQAQQSQNQAGSPQATAAPTQRSQPESQNGQAQPAVQPTQENVQSQPDQQGQPEPQQQPAGASCNGATTCGQMTSCAQAYACLAAGLSRLDADSDGIPCESICGG
jgi:uncharacterized protein YgiM (DUF1202 family)